MTSVESWFSKLSAPAKVYLGLTLLGLLGSFFMIQTTAMAIGIDVAATAVWAALWLYVIDKVVANNGSESMLAWLIAIGGPVAWTFLSTKVVDYFVPNYGMVQYPAAAAF